MLLLVLSPLGPGTPALAQNGAVAEDELDRDAPDAYCGERKLGQWFYCAKPKPAENREARQPPPVASAAEQMAAITKQLDELKARASSSRLRPMSSPMCASSESSSIAHRPSPTLGSARSGRTPTRLHPATARFDHGEKAVAR
jgi:hypothetical protein